MQNGNRKRQPEAAIQTAIEAAKRTVKGEAGSRKQEAGSRKSEEKEQKKIIPSGSIASRGRAKIQPLSLHPRSMTAPRSLPRAPCFTFASSRLRVKPGFPSSVLRPPSCRGQIENSQRTHLLPVQSLPKIRIWRVKEIFSKRGVFIYGRFGNYKRAGG
jgi:hypothetical protein